MISKNLKDKYPFLTEYFERGMGNDSHSLAHSMLLYGQDVQAQYDLAQEIARILNCKEGKSEDCKCLNCNWIREKKHPAVMTVSKLDSKPSDDESKTVISVKQSQMVKSLLMNTSEYHRVFIFCDAEIVKTNEGETWRPLPLNQVNFQEETANSLLKVVEEPPENITFFFLTRDKNDIIETIISRSQSFFVPSLDNVQLDDNLVSDLFSDYLDFERKDAFDLAQKVFLIGKEKGFYDVLDQIQNYLLRLIKSNLNNSGLKIKVMNDIKAVELAKKMVKSYVSPQSAIEQMFLSIIK